MMLHLKKKQEKMKICQENSNCKQKKYLNRKILLEYESGFLGHPDIKLEGNSYSNWFSCIFYTELNYCPPICKVFLFFFFNWWVLINQNIRLWTWSNSLCLKFKFSFIQWILEILKFILFVGEHFISTNEII